LGCAGKNHYRVPACGNEHGFAVRMGEYQEARWKPSHAAMNDFTGADEKYSGDTGSAQAAGTKRLKECQHTVARSSKEALVAPHHYIVRGDVAE
jgi:hypothetical protein